MNIIVPVKMTPDPVEDLTVAPDGRALDRDAIRFRLGDSDEHAIEQALLLKEQVGGTVSVVALDAPEIDDALFTALAKGADRAVKLVPPADRDVRGPGAASLLAAFLRPAPDEPGPDTLILIRGQAADEIDGEIGALLAQTLDLPHLPVVTRVAPEGAGVVATKEFAGGLRGEFFLPLPAVIGIQSAERPPRYVPIAKVRAAMKSARIETIDVSPPDPTGPAPERVYQPEASTHAQMLEGTPEQVADRIVELLAQHGIV